MLINELIYEWEGYKSRILTLEYIQKFKKLKIAATEYSIATIVNRQRYTILSTEEVLAAIE